MTRRTFNSTHSPKPTVRAMRSTSSFSVRGPLMRFCRAQRGGKDNHAPDAPRVDRATSDPRRFSSAVGGPRLIQQSGGAHEGPPLSHIERRRNLDVFGRLAECRSRVDWTLQEVGLSDRQKTRTRRYSTA